MTDAKKARPRLRRVDRIAEIMTAARAVIARGDGTDLPIGEVASRLGIVDGAIYRFFPTKRQLMIAVISDWYTDVMAGYEAALQELTGVRAQLRFVVSHHLQCIRDSPEIVNLYFSAIRTSPEYAGSDLHRLNRRYANQVIRIISEGVLRGELRSDMPSRMGRDILFGVVEQQTWGYRMGRAELNIDEIADSVTDLIYQAFVRTARNPANPHAVSAQLLDLSEVLRRLAGELRT